MQHAGIGTYYLVLFWRYSLHPAFFAFCYMIDFGPSCTGRIVLKPKHSILLCFPYHNALRALSVLDSPSSTALSSALAFGAYWSSPHRHSSAASTICRVDFTSTYIIFLYHTNLQRHLGQSSCQQLSPHLRLLHPSPAHQQLRIAQRPLHRLLLHQHILTMLLSKLSTLASRSPQKRSRQSVR